MFNKFLFLIPILGLILIFSGCINSVSDLEAAAFANGAIASFKDAHPNAQFNAVLWNASDLEIYNDKVLNICNKELAANDYYYFNLTDDKDVIEGFLTKDSYDLVCVKSYIVKDEVLVDDVKNTNVSTESEVKQEYSLKIKGKYNEGNMTNVGYVLFSYMCDLDNVFELKNLAEEKRNKAWNNNSSVDIKWGVESNLGMNREYLNIAPGEGDCEYVYSYYFNPDNEIMKVLPEGKYVLGLFKNKVDFVSSDYGTIKNNYDKISALEFNLDSNMEINIVVEKMISESDDSEEKVEDSTEELSTTINVVGDHSSAFGEYLPSDAEVCVFTDREEIIECKNLVNNKTFFTITNEYNFTIKSKDGKINMNPLALSGFGDPKQYGDRYEKLIKKDGKLYFIRVDDGASMDLSQYDTIDVYLLAPLVEEYSLVIKSTYDHGNMTTVPYVLFNYGCNLGDVLKMSDIAQNETPLGSVDYNPIDNLVIPGKAAGLIEADNCTYIYSHAFDPENKITKTFPEGKYVLGLFKENYWYNENFTTDAYALESSNYGTINAQYDKITALEFELNSNTEINIATKWLGILEN